MFIAIEAIRGRKVSAERVREEWAESVMRAVVSGFSLNDTIGEGRGDTFKNPVTGDEHLADLVLPDGFIWTRGECGVGTFKAKAGPLNVSFDKTNWIFYKFDWNNAKAAAA